MFLLMSLDYRRLYASMMSSLWFVPSLVVLAAILLASLTTLIDQHIRFERRETWGIVFGGGPEAARQVLSTVASSMITVAGVVFSITIVALSLASQQFGPRLLRNFMRDRGNQLVLGTFIGTFLYSLLVLRIVKGQDDLTFVPNLGVTTSIALSIVSIGVLIYFIHHVASSINASHLIQRVYEELLQAIDDLYPVHLGTNGKGASDPAAIEAELAEYRGADVVVAEKAGYLQVVDSDQLFEVAKRDDFVVRLLVRPGQFVDEGGAVVNVYPQGRAGAASLEKVRSSMKIGAVRTPEQDVEFLLDQLVEIGIRALSPSVNDEFTAIACVDFLGAGLSRLSQREPPSAFRRDSDGSLRIVATVPHYRGALDRAFDQIRQSSAAHPAVVIRLMETLERLGRAASTGDQYEALAEHARKVYGLRATFFEETDQEALERRWKRTMEVLSSGTDSPSSQARQA
jgi:uncharacterized membrane protein